MSRPPVALYVHFPFCLSICPYCDFVVYAGRAARGPGNEIERFVQALTREIELRGRPAALTSVYLGGGTPSLMTSDQVRLVLGAADAAFGIASGAEISIEVNPAPADRGDLAGFRAAGVNRISIGAQSMEASELRALGRRHAPADIVATVGEARAAGFDDLSLDLLYDVPGQSLASWGATLEAVLELEPDHVSAYALTLDGADLAAGDDHLAPRAGATQWRARARSMQDEDRAADMYELAEDRLARAGLTWYEISNWSRPGHESRHNQAYWKSQPWEAVGPGAHAFDGARTRRWNAAGLHAYVTALESGVLPPGAETTSDRATADAERLILALRMRHGLEPPTDFTQGWPAVLDWASDLSLIESSPAGRATLTVSGRLLANEIFRRLLPT